MPIDGPSATGYNAQRGYSPVELGTNNILLPANPAFSTSNRVDGSGFRTFTVWILCPNPVGVFITRFGEDGATALAANEVIQAGAAPAGAWLPIRWGAMVGAAGLNEAIHYTFTLQFQSVGAAQLMTARVWMRAG